MNKRELKLRQDLARTMAGAWNLTLHAESRLNPGVPDLSFVLTMPDCETGWLELKAMPWDRKLSITVEPGQHSWMEAHAKRIPAYFLIEVSEKLYLLHGRFHGRLIDPITPDDLAGLSYREFSSIQDRSSIHSALWSITDRGRFGTTQVLR